MIELSILGGVRLSGGDPERLAGLLAQPKRVALLAYLTIARPRGFQNRDTLLALFWPELDERHARWALNQAVHYLRLALGEGAVLRRGDDVSLDVACVNCDAIALEAACAARQWDKAVRLYEGELLPGLRPGGAAELEHWLDGERERLRRLAAEAARNRSEELLAQGDVPGAVTAAREAVRLAPDDETRIRRLMELLGAGGDRAGAAGAYHEFAAWLKSERELEPAPETRALLDALQEDYSVPPVQGRGTSRDVIASADNAQRRRRVGAAITLATVLAVVGGVAIAFQLVVFKPLAITASDFTQISDDPGVEYQPAISPDGKEVAYLAGSVFFNHLVIRATENTSGGGEIRPADSEFDSERFPMWTPQGDRLRFMGCGYDYCDWFDIGQMGGLVNHTKLPTNSNRAKHISVGWAPGGDTIVYGFRDTVFVSPIADTASARPIAVQPQPPSRFNLHSFAWSPDGTRLAYVQGNLGWVDIGNLGSSFIWVVSAAGGTPWQATSGEHLNVYPVWLDNRHLLFVSDRDGARGVYVVEVGPQGARGAPRIIPGIVDPHSISFAIAAQRLAWAKYMVRSNIWSYPLRGRAPISIRKGVRVTTANEVVELIDVSADGQRIAFDSKRRGNQDLYALSLADGSLVPVTNAPWDEAGPRWSPDGTEIAFHAELDRAGSQTASVMIVPAAGGKAQALTKAPGLNTYPTWSPDGLHIAFASTRTGRGAVWLLSRDTLRGPWHEAVRLSALHFRVHDWAPDGRGVLIGDRTELALVSIQGAMLWKSKLPALGIVQHWWARFSRDGSIIYVVGDHRDRRSGVWAIPMGQGPARLVVAADDPALTLLGPIAVGRDRLYLTVSEYESDIWTAKLTW